MKELYNRIEAVEQKHTEFEKFIGRIGEIFDFMKENRDFQTKTTRTLDKIDTALTQIPAISNRVAELEKKSFAYELAEKDQEIRYIKQREKDRDDVFKAIRVVEKENEKTADDFKAFRNKLIGYAVGAAVAAGGGTSLIIKLIG